MCFSCCTLQRNDDSTTVTSTPTTLISVFYLNFFVATAICTQEPPWSLYQWRLSRLRTMTMSGLFWKKSGGRYVPVAPTIMLTPPPIECGLPAPGRRCRRCVPSAKWSPHSSYAIASNPWSNRSLKGHMLFSNTTPCGFHVLRSHCDSPSGVASGHE